MILLENRFFSGFCFYNESELFSDYLQENALSIAGFSYGAQKAFEYTLNTNKRVDLLQLFSPAFFQNKDDKYKRMQLMFFKKDENSYTNTFLQNANYASNKNIEQFFKQDNIEDLSSLLNYIWEEEKLQILVNKGVKIEVFLGSEDKIIDSEVAYEFFKKYATVYYIKDVGHIL